MKTRPVVAMRLRTIVTFAVLFSGIAAALMAEPLTAAAEAGSGPEGQAVPAAQCQISGMGSPYIPVDSWVYPALYRRYSL